MPRSLSEGVSSFLAMDVLEKAQELERQGRHVIHLEIGQPDFPTPTFICEAAAKAARDGHTGYTHSLGLLPLREAIAAYYEREYGIAVSPERIVVTNGSSPALLLLFMALLRPGDSVLLPDPTYACYSNCIGVAGGTCAFLPTREQDGFQLKVNDIAARQAAAAAILINSPSNPAGTIIPADDLKALCSLGVPVISDEIYHGLVYEGRAYSALQFNADACVVDGFSKRYAMTGWRLGWMVLPERLVAPVQRMQQNFFICAGSAAQWAGIAALEHGRPEVERMAAEYNRRRVVLLEGLRALGFGVSSAPVGAFYILANARHLGEDSLALSFDILEKAGVGCAPGVDFGSGGEGYLRFAYANSLEHIEEALHRLKLYLEQREVPSEQKKRL